MDLLLFGTEKNFTEDDFLSLVEDTEQQYNVEGEQLLKEEQDYNWALEYQRYSTEKYGPFPFPTRYGNGRGVHK